MSLKFPAIIQILGVEHVFENYQAEKSHLYPKDSEFESRDYQLGDYFVQVQSYNVPS